MVSRFDYLKKNLILMAELALEQVINLVEAMEADSYEKVTEIIKRDDRIDELEKENDNLSQLAILDVVASRDLLKKGKEGESDIENDPLRFALSVIRITRHFERIGDQVVNSCRAFNNKNIQKGLFKKSEDLTLILSRVVTIVGMAVESLVEEKYRFFGSVQKVEDELDRQCIEFFHKALGDERFSRAEFADLYRIIISFERIGDLALDIAMELVRLQTGQDLRHILPDAV